MTCSRSRGWQEQSWALNLALSGSKASPLEPHFLPHTNHQTKARPTGSHKTGSQKAAPSPDHHPSLGGGANWAAPPSGKMEL